MFENLKGAKMDDPAYIDLVCCYIEAGITDITLARRMAREAISRAANLDTQRDADRERREGWAPWRARGSL